MLGLFALCAVLVSVNSQDVGINSGRTQKQTLRPSQGKSCNINNYNSFYAGPNKKVENLLVDVKRQLEDLQKQVALLRKDNKTNLDGNPRSCVEIFKSGQKISGVYSVDPDGAGAFEVYCDQTTAGGGWTVFQKRQDGSVDFYRDWADYKNGFGNLNGEFWLGLGKVNRITNSERYRLRVDMEDTEGKTAYAEYDMFSVTSEKTKYQLSIGTYSGDAGDSLSGHRDAAFSTRDQDNDNNGGSSCAVSYKGAWWYTDCHSSNLNGFYHHGKHSSYADGVNWQAWKGYKYSLKRAEMKIRPSSL